MTAAQLRKRLSDERGQLAVFVVIMIATLIGMASLVLDAGAWFRDQRHLQQVADSAALAGAQVVAFDHGTATSLALDYTTKNDGPNATISFPTANSIDVTVEHEQGGFLSKVYGVAFDQVTIHGHAVARELTPSRVSGVVPIVVTDTEPMLTECAGPCTGPGNPTRLGVNSDTSLGGGQMGLVDLTGNGSVTAQQITDWVVSGLNGTMEPNRYYYSAGSCKFSNQNFHAALDAKIASGTSLLFPVYDPSRTDQGTNPPRYWIVGWAAFVITGYRLNGCGGKNDYIDGYFVRDLAQGGGDPDSVTPDFGVYVVSLVA